MSAAPAPESHEERPADEPEQRAQRRGGERHREIGHGPEPIGRHPMQQLGDAVGMDDDRRLDPFAALEQGRERRAVTIVERADQHDLAGEPRGRKSGDEIGRIFAKRRFGARRPSVPDDARQLRRGGNARRRGERAVEARDEAAVASLVAGIDPAHGVELVGAQGREPARGGRQKAVEEVALRRGDDAVLVGIARDQRHGQSCEDPAQPFVLRRLGRLREQDVEADGARMACGDRRNEIGEEAAIDRRGVGEILQGLIGDGDDEHVGVLRLGRQERRRLPIADEAIDIFEEGEPVDREVRECRAEQRDDERRRRRDEHLPRADERGAVHGGKVLKSACACGSQPTSASHAACISGLTSAFGTSLTVMFASLASSRMR